jgi:murein L,D-transpeptidase YafK
MRTMLSRKHVAGLLAAGLMLGIAGCQGGPMSLFPKAQAPIPFELARKMEAQGMAVASPILIRIYKEENLVEVWKQKGDGRYGLLTEYEICKWSGKLGPKFQEGDRQAPEGFYTIKPWQMNPQSDYHLAFNLGFPNAFDRAHERTGSHLMMHGACSSAGCYSMTDERIEEIFALAREAFKGGQQEFQVQAFPFRMTPENLARHRDSKHFEFWKMLKEGHDHFEITRLPPKVDVCGKRYVFNRIAEDEDARISPAKECPAMNLPENLALAYSERLAKDEQAFREVLRKEAVLAAWRGEKANSGATTALSLISEPSEPARAAANAATATPVSARIDAVNTAAINAAVEIPVPQAAPREERTRPEQPKKRAGFFALFRRGS